MREMKDSGVEWIGEIPKDWKLERLQWHLNEIVEKNDPIVTTQVLSLTNKKGVIPYEEKGAQGNVAKESYDGYKIAYPNTIVANSMNILIGSVGYSNYYGCVSPVYYVFKEKDNNDLRFINYIMQTSQFQKELRRYANGILEIRLRVSSGNILKRFCAFPDYQEQSRIADYLDSKCSQIDDIIEKQQTIIEKLKEYKLSIISEVVTNGLKFDVEKKKSSIPYIGSIPKHWLQTNFGNALELIQIGPFGSQLHADDYIDNGTIFLINPANIQNGKIVGDVQCTLSEEKAFSLKQHMMQVGDIVFARRGEMGRCACVEDDGNRYFCGTGSIRLKCNPILDSMYATFYLQTSYVKQYLELNAVGTTMANLNSKIISDIPILLPPIEEQQLIINYLNKEILNIDDLLDKQLSLVKKLQEYKKSLIYEVVTGKKEV